MYLSYSDIIVLLGIAQGIFLAIIFPVLHKTNVKANRILAILLAMASVMLLSRTLSLRVRSDLVLQWVNLADMLIFLFGPLAYAYFGRLLFKNRTSIRIGWHHFLPALAHFMFFLYLLGYTPEEYRALHYGGYFNLSFRIIEGAAIVLNFYYVLEIMKLVSRYQKREKDQLSFNQQVIKFVIVVLILVTILLVVWLLSYLSQHFLRIPIRVIGYEKVWICLPIVIYVIGFYAIRQPEIFRISKNTIKTMNRLDEDEIGNLKKKLNNLMVSEYIYLDGELTLGELAKKAQTSTNNLSWLLNTVYNTNFYDYVNHHRINAFVQRVDQGEHLQKTLLAMAMDVGFNSKSTFNKAFKAIMDETPTNYIKKKKDK